MWAFRRRGLELSGRPGETVTETVTLFTTAPSTTANLG